jgi:nickel-dependent lactate racemase
MYTGLKLTLKYGRSTRQLNIPGTSARVHLLASGRSPPAADGDALVRAALDQPIASAGLADLARAGQTVSIITSDITRPCPSHRLLPPVLEQLARVGVRDDDVTVVFGLGSHRPHTEAERSQLAGPAIHSRVRCVDSDPSAVERIGLTRRGTPVDIFRPVLEADLRICLGVIEYHFFVGYSGGHKALVPGVCGLETIQSNHRMMLAPGAVGGNRDGNPVRDDIDEAGAMVGCDFLLNVILDAEKRIVAAVAGDPLAAHKEGCARLDAFGRAEVPQPVDLVVVSAGGFPKDLNLYQAQKGLENARLIVRPGGAILLLAECGEGFGHPTFERWMREADGPASIMDRLATHFVLGGHKAAAVARAMYQATIYLVSALPADVVRGIGLRPYDCAQRALDAALAQVGADATIAVISEGSAVLPSLSP